MADSSLSSISPSARAAKSPRQRPGLSCLNCRARKLKCDGEQPQCGHCLAGDVKCVTPLTSSKRGPPKGHLKLLQSRLATLERQVLLQGSCNPMLDPPVTDSPLAIPTMGAGVIPSQHSSGSGSMGTEPDEHVVDDGYFGAEYGFNEAMLCMAGDAFPLPTPPSSSIMSVDCQTMPMENTYFPFDSSVETPETSAAQLTMSDLLRTDLEQLYFERTHRFVPIINQRRYFSWARSPHKTEAQMCLQSAMAMSAASLSSQTQSVRESLYDTTMRSLAVLEARDGLQPCVEHVQARVLVLIYDFMRSSHTRGWMSAGQCFRLIQLMRLFDTDTAGQHRHDGGAPVDWITIEEQRRTFWIAFCLDIHISIRQEWPLMLHEHTKSVRLPMPEENFQDGNYVEMGYLPDDLGRVDHGCQSPFNEFIICSAIYMRSTLHRQLTHFDPGMDPTAFWARHEKLDAAIRNRADAHHHYGSRFPQSDPILLFTFMSLQMIVLALSDTIELVSWKDPDSVNAALDYQRRALSAAATILEYAKSLAHVSCLKAHPFTPFPLHACVHFFHRHHYIDEAHEAHLCELEQLLREMNVVNNLARRRGGGQ